MSWDVGGFGSGYPVAGERDNPRRRAKRILERAVQVRRLNPRHPNSRGVAFNRCPGWGLDRLGGSTR